MEPEFEAGLMDIEGFSHLFVIWLFDRADGYELKGSTDRQRATVCLQHVLRGGPIGSA